MYKYPAANGGFAQAISGNQRVPGFGKKPNMPQFGQMPVLEQRPPMLGINPPNTGNGPRPPMFGINPVTSGNGQRPPMFGANPIIPGNGRMRRY